MLNKTVAVYFDPWSKSNKVGSNLILKIKARYLRAVMSKSNARNQAYMQTLLMERFPNAELLTYGCDNQSEKLLSADIVVLLYPDSIGLGFGRVEKTVFASLKPGSDVLVLNGRQRTFPLGLKQRRDLRVRRFLEKSMLCEFAFTVAFIALTPFMLAFDILRGRT